jgi:hypothetical protein
MTSAPELTPEYLKGLILLGAEVDRAEDGRGGFVYRVAGAGAVMTLRDWCFRWPGLRPQPVPETIRNHVLADDCRNFLLAALDQRLP